MPKAKRPPRKAAFEFDRSAPVPLGRVVNFGPVTLAELEAIGITTLDQLEDLGFEETARRWVERFPERLNANAFLGIAATLDGVKGTEASERHRALARALVQTLRRELHLPPAKPPRSRRPTPSK